VLEAVSQHLILVHMKEREGGEGGGRGGKGGKGECRRRQGSGRQ
jgi:hypothetical protein